MSKFLSDEKLSELTKEDLMKLVEGGNAQLFDEKGDGGFNNLPVDLRFISSTNQAKQCWTAYNEALICLKKIDQGEKSAKPEDRKFLKFCSLKNFIMKTVCPNDWQEAWGEAREPQEGTKKGKPFTFTNWFGIDLAKLPGGDDDEDDDDDDDDDDDEE